MNNTVQEMSWIQTSFAAMEANMNGASQLPVHQLRKEALSSLTKTGFPTAKDEDWKYTNVRDLLKRSYSLADKSEVAIEFNQLVYKDAKYKAVFIDGSYHAEQSNLPAEVEAKPLSELLKDSSNSLVKERLAEYKDWGAYAALNTAFSQDGFFLHLKSGQELSEPIHLIFFTSSSSIATHPRIILELEANTKSTIVESYYGAGAGYFTTALTQVKLGAGAYCDHYRIQDESLDAFHFSSLRIEQADKSIFRTHSFAFGSATARSEVWPVLNGSELDSTLNGLNVLSGKQHVDNFTVIDHAQPNSESHEHYKGVYSDQSKGVFSGTIIVRPDAQKTNAFQSNNSILLSDRAQAHSKPQLKIWADDVKCSHGATIGELDEEGMFYLISRGIDKEQSRNILIRAFANEIVGQVKLEALREPLLARIAEKLAVS
ncbi:MAG: Fe-S cluster assembly protein SufD [Bdellovibrionota bacterium]